MWRDDWLSRLPPEAVLEPEAEIIDAHHHLWQLPGRGTYFQPEFQADTASGHHVTRSVYIECTWGYRTSGPEHLRPVAETEFAVSQAQLPQWRTGTQIAAIVGFARLQDPRLDEILDAHQVAGQGRFRGIRQCTAHDADPEIPDAPGGAPLRLMERDDFRAGLAALAERGLVFDSYLFHPQIPELTAAARAVPRVKIALNHFGAPLAAGGYAGKRAWVIERWRESIAELAECPNVYLKLGGIGMPRIGFGLDQRELPPSSAEIAELWQPLVDHVLTCFGADRCLAESNFPVDRDTCSYRTLWNAIKLLISDLSPVERNRVLRGTASELYRI